MLLSKAAAGGRGERLREEVNLEICELGKTLSGLFPGPTAARVQPMRPDSNQLFTSEQAFLRPFCPCGVKSFYVIWRAYLKIMGRMPA